MAIRQQKDWAIELGKYDEIQQVFISYREFGIQGIAFSIKDAIGKTKNHSFGVKYYNHAMKLKPNEHITQLSGKTNKIEQQTIISSLRIHTNLRPNRLSGSEDTSNPEEKENKFSVPVITRDGSIIVKISATDNRDVKKGNEPAILSSIRMDVEEEVDSNVLIWNNVSGISQELYSGLEKMLVVDTSKNWSLKLERCEYIKELLISHDDTTVYGVGFVKIDAEGRITPTQWFSGRGGEIYRIILKFNEYIVRISGTSREGMIKSLRIYTNLWPNGYRLCGNPSLDSSTSSFSSPVQTSDCIAEFYGSGIGSNLTLIGIVVKRTEIQRREVLIPVEEKKSNVMDGEVSTKKKSNTKSEGASALELEKKSDVKSEEGSIPEMEKKSNTKSEGASIPELEKKSNVKSEEASILEKEKESNVKSEEASIPKADEKKDNNIKSEETSILEMEKKSNVKSEESSILETDKKGNVKSEATSIPELEKKSNVKSDEASIPETKKKGNVKSEETSIPETEKKSNVKSEEASIPEKEKKSNDKSEEALIPEKETKSYVKSEEASTTEMKKNGNIKSEEAVVPEMEKKSNIKSEEASIPESEEKSNVKSEEASTPEMEKKSNVKSEEALIP